LKTLHFGYLLLLIAVVGCAGTTVVKSPLEKALTSNDPRIKRVMENLKPYELQIRFTRIERTKDSILFRDYDFQVDENTYFYPASTVKFPIAVLALEKLNSSNNISINTKFYIEGDTLETTFAREITKVFAVSDNDANNRLIEFLGQDAINQGLLSKNISPVRIAHRLSTPNSDDVTTKPLIIYLNDSTTTILAPTTNRPPQNLMLKGVTKGIGYYAEDSLLLEPFDFSLKNYYPISSQHGVLKRVIFPEAFPIKERFNLSAAQRKFLLNAMQLLPKEAGYDPEEYYDSYGKFFMYGDSKEPMPTHVTIYNKVGYAYGTLTDCAYVKDEKNEVEFLITATILVNEDGIFNDNAYEYDEIGIPFLAALGQELYSIEDKR
jgi:hypothetical protein